MRYCSYVSWTVFFLCNMSRPSSLVIQWHRVLLNPNYPLKLIHKYNLVHLIVRVGVYWQFSSKIFFTIILVIFHTVKFLHTYKLSLDWFSENLHLTFPSFSHYNEVRLSYDLLSWQLSYKCFRFRFGFITLFTVGAYKQQVLIKTNKIQ